LVGATPVTAGWKHLAIVVSGGATTFYVDRVANGTGPAPNSPTANFNVGIRADGAESFDGRIDEVRAFTFNPGEFNPTTDLIPEPSAIALVAIGALGAGLRRRR